MTPEPTNLESSDSLSRGIPMRRFALCAACLFAGLAVGASLRFSAHYRTGFHRGRAAAIAEMRMEAVREGHGRWERDPAGGLNRFVWNAVRSPQYAPDAMTMIPGLE